MNPSDTSTSALVSELCTMRDQLRQVISACKKVLPYLEPAQRMALLDALIEAERKLS